MELKKYKLGEICPEFHTGNGILIFISRFVICKTPFAVQSLR